MLIGTILAVNQYGRRGMKPTHRVPTRTVQVSKTFTEAHSLVAKDDSKASSHLKSILEGNKKWVEERKDADPTFFDKLAKPQTPKYLYFGCADSRVPANEILGKG